MPVLPDDFEGGWKVEGSDFSYRAGEEASD
jgi:hypothetical protein